MSGEYSLQQLSFYLPDTFVDEKSYKIIELDESY